jgi:polar amino acid transport system substrate-binding protein
MSLRPASPISTGRHHRRSTMVAGALLVCTAVLLAACSSSKSNTATTGTTAAPTTTVPTTAIPTATKDASLAAMVPAKLTTAGKAVVATDASYAPNEFFASDNTTIIGMDIDLGHAIGQVLGVPFDFTNASFDSIIPAMGTRYDVSMSSFTDTLARQQKVDMVTYFSAGTSFYVTKGENSDLGSLSSLCGKSVGVEKGTTEATDATAQSVKCTKDGKSKVDVQQFPDQNGANVALASGRVAVVMADSPVAAYAVEQSAGKFALAGNPYGTAPYGIVVPKTSDYAGMSNAILGALKVLDTDGIYAKIMTKWGVSSGSISNFALNGATS